jgi:hypothetical protein
VIDLSETCPAATVRRPSVVLYSYEQAVVFTDLGNPSPTLHLDRQRPREFQHPREPREIIRAGRSGTRMPSDEPHYSTATVTRKYVAGITVVSLLELLF